MKTASKMLPFVVLLVCCHAVRGGDDTPGIGIAMDIHKVLHMGEKEAGLPWLNNEVPRACFDVVVENTSSKPLLLPRRALDALYFEVTDEHGKVMRVDRIPPAQPSAPGFVLLEPGGCTTVEIHYVVPLLRSGAMMRSAGGRDLGEEGPLDGKYPFPFPPAPARRQVTVRAILECATGGDSVAQRGIWLGKAESEPLAVILWGRNNPISLAR